MKLLFYSPYLNILGGGEKHLLQFASCVSAEHDIVFAWKNSQDVHKGLKRFNISIRSPKFIPKLPKGKNLSQYDLVFVVSDGSIPFLPLNKSIVFFMSPFTNVKGRSVKNQLKLKLINHIICNSGYTKKFIDHEFSVNSKVIYPAVDISRVQVKKRNLILSVGRFSTTLHVKKHQALIDSFIDLENKLSGWKLVLAGGTEKGSDAIVSKLKQRSQGHRISIETDVSSQRLGELYGQAKLYWHGAGLDADLSLHPEKAEHFGISIIEAMAHGVVPLAFNAGGPKEIITPTSGKFWRKVEELKKHTLKLSASENQRKIIASAALKRAKYFSKQRLCKKFYELVKN